MLILTRKIGQRIWLDDICITVVETGRGRMRLGIDAPLSVKILREELIDSEELKLKEKLYGKSTNG